MRIVLEGGTHHGETRWWLDDDTSVLFDVPFEPHEFYRRTNETTSIDGAQHVIFRLDPSAIA